MKKIIENIVNVLLLVSVVLMFTATIVSLGYTLFLWANGSVLSVAWWSGFVLWTKLRQLWLICLVLFFGGLWYKFNKDMK